MSKTRLGSRSWRGLDAGSTSDADAIGLLRLTGALGLVDPRYTRIAPGVVDVDRGSDFLNTPRTTSALAADGTQPLPSGRLDAHVDYSWRDEAPFDYDPRSVARQPSCGLWNARATRILGDSGIDVSVWARNLADTRWVTGSTAEASSCGRRSLARTECWPGFSLAINHLRKEKHRTQK